MSKILSAFLGIAFLSVVSCTTKDETAHKPAVGPISDESDMPWNRPTVPEGAGALGILNDR